MGEGPGIPVTRQGDFRPIPTDVIASERLELKQSATKSGGFIVECLIKILRAYGMATLLRIGSYAACVDIILGSRSCARRGKAFSESICA